MVDVLENLPTELIEKIFENLSGSYIFFSFRHLNNRSAEIVNDLRYFSLDFRLINKYIFDSTIKSIEPLKVRSLILSSSVETTGQIKLFFSYWKLGDFVNVHLNGIETDLLSSISFELFNLAKLVNLRIDGIKFKGDVFAENTC